MKTINLITTILGVISIIAGLVYPFTKYCSDWKFMIVFIVAGLWLIYLKNKGLQQFLRKFVDKANFNNYDNNQYLDP